MSKDLVKVAQQFYISGDFFNARNLYKKLNLPLETAYCELFLGNLSGAKKIIEKLDLNSPAEEWLLSLSQMIESSLDYMPSYLQIRNFFEVDLNNLFLCGKKEWIENVINHIPILATINPEVFKLSARVLKNNGQDILAQKFLKKSLDIYFNDSETHFLLAEIYLKNNEISLAKKHLEYSCENERYFPAQKLLSELN